MSEHTHTLERRRDELAQRRDQMQAEEGHSGSIPRGNQDLDDHDVRRGREKTERISTGIPPLRAEESL